MTAVAPRSLALETATVIPRSLKEQVGFSPSYFNQSSNFPPMAATKFSTRTSAVFPSLRVTTGVASETGRERAYRVMTPCHGELRFGGREAMNSAAGQLLLMGVLRGERR